MDASTSGSDLLSRLVYALKEDGLPLRTCIGGYRPNRASSAAARPFKGWVWVDGTNDTNLNLGSVGSGPFALDEPE